MPFREKWSNFWRTHDPDDVFAYDTIKFVTIRDRYLGILHHVFQLGILIYVLGIVILYQKQFLRREVPDGLIRMSIINGPAGAVDTGAQAGCSTNYSGLGPWCVYPTQDEIVTGGGSSLLHLATYYTATDYTKTCVNPSTCNTTASPTTSYIVGNFNQFNLSIDHSFQTVSGVTLGDYVPQGYLDARKTDKNGKSATYKKRLVEFHSLSADSISIPQILAATNAKGSPFDMGAVANDYLQYEPNYVPQSNRQFGVVLLLVVSYSNIKHYYGGCARNKDPCFEYDYHVAQITSVEDYAQETVYTVYPSQRTYLEKRGVRIMAIMSGEIGSFNFQVLLVQLTTSLALIKVATLIVDQIACRFLPRKAFYKDSKYERTEDASDLFGKKKEKANELHEVGGASVATNSE